MAPSVSTGGPQTVGWLVTTIGQTETRYPADRFYNWRSGLIFPMPGFGLCAKGLIKLSNIVDHREKMAS